MDTFDQKHKYFSRGLRKEQTPSEIIVWNALRNRQYKGLKFRRQHILLNYVVDFYCHELSLIIEIDGAIHKQQLEYDQTRQQTLEDKGYVFIRLKNEQITEGLNLLYSEIDKHL